MFSNIKEFPIEIGVVLAIAAIVVIGRAFMSQGTERKRKNEDSKEEDNSKRSRSEKEEVADAAEGIALLFIFNLTYSSCSIKKNRFGRWTVRDHFFPFVSVFTEHSLFAG